MKGETRSCPLSLLSPPPPHFIPIVGIPNNAISTVAEWGATWSGCAGLGYARTAGCIERSP